MNGGGYYSYPISQNLSIMVLNSVAVNYKNDENYDKGWQMLAWMEELLQESIVEGKKYILLSHIMPGLYYFDHF